MPQAVILVPFLKWKTSRPSSWAVTVSVTVNQSRSSHSMSGSSYSERLNTKADELKAKSMEEAPAARKEIQTLDELIAKYKVLAESDTQDSGTQEEIANVQGERFSGQQAANGIFGCASS